MVTAIRSEGGMTTLAEELKVELNDRARKIEENIEGIEAKLKRKDLSDDKRTCLRFHLSRAIRALQKRQEELAEFAGI